MPRLSLTHLLIFSFACITILVGCSTTAVAPPVDESIVGSLILADQPRQAVERLDLVSDEIGRIFTVPPQGFIYQLDVAPSQDQAIIAYTSPPSEGEAALFDRSGIYTLDLSAENAQPEHVLGDDLAGLYYLQPVWAPDGESVYTVLSFVNSNDANDPVTTTLVNYELDSGNATPLAQNAVWPRVSADGERITYIQFEPTTQERGLNVIDSDGENGTVLLEIGRFFDIDSPHFSPDGEWIYFTVAPDPEAQRSLFDIVMGVRVAEAHADHNIPSTWWRISVEGGEPEQVTTQEDVITFGEFNPAGTELYYTSLTGLYRLTVATGNIEQINESTFYRTMSWISE